VLDYLSAKYTLHIITNGFEEVQHLKIKNCGLDKYFKEVITSERANAKKPSADIFNFALSATGATVENSLMIGDSWEADIDGARNFGMDQVFICRSEKERQSQGATYFIDCLSELKGLL
jgi:putative hydrolase of the HAD superfamily